MYAIVVSENDWQSLWLNRELEIVAPTVTVV
jgi:hypothetical protein